MNFIVGALLLLNSLSAYSTALLVGSITGSTPFADMSTAGNGVYFYGFSIDIMNDICKRLAMECIYSQTKIGDQLLALEQQTVDVVLLASPCGTIQLQPYALSLPYLTSHVSFIAMNNSPLKKGDPIKNLKIGVMKSTFYELLKNSPYQEYNQIIPFNSVPDLISGVLIHEVDVVVINSDIARYFVSNDLYKIKPIAEDVPLGEGYGIVALKKNVALINKINGAILDMQKDGTYLKIYNHYQPPVTK